MNNDDNSDVFHIDPHDENALEACFGCRGGDALAFVFGLEGDLRLVSVDLWIAGWAPAELIAEVRRTTGYSGSTALVSQLLIVDDSHRSEQARPAAWAAEIERLRAQTGVDDDAMGWLGRWITGHSNPAGASRCLHATIVALSDLVDPRAVA